MTPLRPERVRARARVPPRPAPVFRVTLASRLQAFAPAARRLRHWLQTLGAREGARRDITLILDELFTNIVLHGYRGREDGWIQMQVWRQGAHLHLQLRDGAPGFNPTNPVPPPDLSLSLEQRVPGGLGLMFVRHLSDEIGYRRLSRARPRDPTAGPDLNQGDRTDAQTGINELRLVYHLARPRR